MEDSQMPTALIAPKIPKVSRDHPSVAMKMNIHSVITKSMESASPPRMQPMSPQATLRKE